jgi:hypothetical protein
MPGTAATNPAMPLSSAQFASLPPDQQAGYLRTLPPQSQAMLLKDVRVLNNRRFMRQSIEKYAYCPVSGGSGTSATYSSGTTLVFDLPVVGSGYAKALLVTYNLTVTLAVGTAATYLPTMAAPFNIFSELLLNYNGAQARMHPYLLKVMDEALGFERGIQNAVIAGQSVAGINTAIGGSAAPGFAYPTTSPGANTWQGKILLRLNAIDEMSSVPGMLPVMGVGNKPQLKLTCAPNFYAASPDPLLVPVGNGPSGTGQALTSVTGTINVDMIYYDGTTMTDPSGIPLDLTAEPTLQYYWDTPLNPLTTGTLNRQHIATLLEHWMVVSVVIDGNTSTAATPIPFIGASGANAGVANIAQFQLSADSVGQQNFQSWNVSNNISIFDYYDRSRRRYGQDFDPGVIIWVDAASHNVPDSDNRNGSLVLNMQAGGYPATTHAYLVNSTSSVNFTPRVETFLVSMNYNGLKIA